MRWAENTRVSFLKEERNKFGENGEFFVTSFSAFETWSCWNIDHNITMTELHELFKTDQICVLRKL